MSIDLNDFEIYKGKTFGSLCKEIITNQNNKKDQLDILLQELRGLIKTVENAMILTPQIKDYMEVGVKNDEQLIKLAVVLQRIFTKSTGESADGGLGLTDAEKADLADLVKEAERVSREASEKSAKPSKE